MEEEGQRKLDEHQQWRISARFQRLRQKIRVTETANCELDDEY